MNPNDRRRPVEHVRPESQPHGTTEDQRREMESAGQGGAAKGSKPTPTSPPRGTITRSMPGARVLK